MTGFRRGGLQTQRLLELVGAGRVPPDLDFLALTLVPGASPPPLATPYADTVIVHDAPPSEALEYRATDSVADAARQLRRGLECTLDRLLVGARRVAVMTGGGLDSGGLLALTKGWAERHGASYFAVSLDFEDEGDDRPYLRALEEHLGCEVLRLPPEVGAAHFLEVQAGIDGAPQLWPNAAMELALYQRARAEGADVVLCGVWGDQLFNGDPRSLCTFLFEGRPLAALDAVKRLRGFSRPEHPVFSWLVRPTLARLAPEVVRRAKVGLPPLECPPWAGPELRSRVEDERLRRRDVLLRSVEGFLEDMRARATAAFAMHRHQILVATGVRRVDPFLDAGLRTLRDRIPPHWLLSGDLRRGLFRRALRDLLPRSLLEREGKARFDAAFRRFVEALGGFDALKELSGVSRLAGLGLVEPPVFRLAYEAFIAAPHDRLAWVRVWPALMLEAFARARFAP